YPSAGLAYPGALQYVQYLSLSPGLPVIYGVITTDTLEQAIERSGTKAGNKGFEAAMSAIEMANLTRVIG
ncbi:unnamed protein product, partial [marine sediment metagenome]